MNKEVLNKNFNFLSLFKFVLPSILSFIFIAIYQMFDGFFIERYVGDIAIGAVDLFIPIVCLFIAVGVMIATGANAVMVKKIGEKNIEGANKTFSNVLIFSGVITIIITAVCLIFAEPIMKGLGASSINIVYLRPYYYYLCAFAFAIIFQSLFGILIIGEGKTVSASVAIIIGGILNCLLDFIFMKYFHMGIKGAAIATVIGYMVLVVYAIWFFFISKKTKYKFVLCKINFKELGKICVNGSSEMISNLAGGITALLMNHLIFKYYKELGVSALSVISYFEAFVVSLFMGFTTAVEPLFSYNYGSLNVKNAKKVFKYSIIWTAILSFLTILICYLLKDNIIGIFFDKGSKVFNITDKGFEISLLACLFVGFNTFISGLFTAYSNGFVSATLSILRTLIIYVITILVLNYLFQEIGLWLSWPIAEAISFIISAIVLIKYRKKYKYV